MNLDVYTGQYPLYLSPQVRDEYGLRPEVIRKVVPGILVEAITEAIETCNREPELQELISRQEGSSQSGMDEVSRT